MTHFDLAIIGSGSGNSLITPDWDGKKVAVIDGGTFGGTCLNVGCIPTKMFVYPAQLAAAAADGARLGVDSVSAGVRWRDIRDRVFGRIDAISEGGRRYRDEELENVTLISENVRFTSPHALTTASGEKITADEIVVAAGSRPVLPDIPGMDLPQVHTSDTVMRIDELPARVLIIGGGYIAAEFGFVFSAFGSDVTVAVRSGEMLRSLDATLSERFTAEASKEWDLQLNTTVDSLVENGDGSVRAVLSGPAGEQAVDVDLVLAATGRTPNTDRLGVDVAGFDVTGDGRLAVDRYGRVFASGTPVPGLWALGDISSPYQLKHVANHEARVVAHNLVHPEDLRAMDHRFVPAAVFSSPQIASVGMTENEAIADTRSRGVELALAVQEYGSTAYGWAMEDTTGFVKLLAERETGRLLGAHIMGHEASMLIQPLVQAMEFGLDAATMARGQYWIHPALTEVVENALLSLKTKEKPGRNRL
ncbi:MULTISPECIES: mycothione reductase [unclassified Arthrobacter]|uniref:mycothione reductase n=1 Tax=unclassified Arthrobacter TaxID=235627 RepID=UPI0024DFF3C6|nr:MULTISPECIES: mycothione reductase [unclassified Arthrobacter]MCC9145015.1 mycothione reductase [Arthrobacter sp. zg-Y919]MDK1276243.1 mycothione reductase [Arthrobacter sp. zg.Y919]WIB02146.1 mycothione reductase [Arthrobacter sp. zg-Y919]